MKNQNSSRLFRGAQPRLPLTRRQVLFSLLAGSGLAALGGPRSWLTLAAKAQEASAESSHHFIFCYFGGGWDILLGLDPRDPERFNESNMDETFIQPAYWMLDDTTIDPVPVLSPEGVLFGPYIGELLNHSSKLSVVRGMSMDTLTHDAGRRRFLTGRPPTGINARGSSASTWLASLLGKGQTLPNLSARVESFNVDQPTYATALRVDSVSDLLKALRPGDYALSSFEEQQLDAMLKTFADCPGAQKSSFYQEGEDARQGSLSLVADRMDSRFDFSANTTEMEAIRSHYGIPSGSSGLSSVQARAAMAVTAITQGLSRCVSMTLADGLDTHYSSWQTDQGPRQRSGFNLIARMIEDLEQRPYGETGDSWLDHTTILAFSEFSRSALVNGNGGRDHAITNAALLAGGGIRGGLAIGTSSDVGLAPSPTNLQTGLPDPGGIILKPENVLRTLFTLAGVEDDVADLRADPIWALLG